MDSHSIIYIFHSDTSEIANAAAANTALARDIHFVLTALVISDFNFKNVEYNLLWKDQSIGKFNALGLPEPLDKF